MLAVALATGFRGLVGPGLAVLGACYALSIGPGLDGRAPLYAGLLLLIAELAYWSFDVRLPIPGEAGTFRLRAAATALAVGVAIGVAATMLALTAVPALPVGAAWELVGIAAAVAALALIAALARARPS